MLRVLLTNDDGIAAPGLLALARAMSAVSELTIIAPDRPQSASSHSITLHKPLRLTERPDVQQATGAQHAIECSGSPADCVTMALQHVCRESTPHLVLSGINDGPNLAEDLIYSGTVAGAVEGAIHGVPALALSLEDCKRGSFAEAATLALLVASKLLYGDRTVSPPPHFAAQAAAAADDWPWAAPTASGTAALSAPLPDPGQWWPDGLLRTPCFNVNIPDMPLAEIRGVRWTALGHRTYKDVVEVHHDPRGKPLYWIWGQRITPEQPPDSDIRANAEGYVSVTPLRADLLNRSDLPCYLAHFAATGVARAES